MLRLTLDTNAIIDLEEERPAATHLRRLLELHATGRVRLSVVGIAASERRQDGTYPTNFGEFQAKLDKVALGDVEILRPPWILGVTYLEWSILTSESVHEELEQISAVLFPGMGFSPDAYRARRELDSETVPTETTWRNHRYDVVALWSHIHYEGDVFVTSDRNFHKVTKRPQLIALGAGNILRPEEAIVVANSS